MRPRAPDGEVCHFCLGHQPSDCFCQGAVDYPGPEGLAAYATRTHGRSLIALCSLAIDDPDADNAVAEGAWSTRERLAAKHGMPDADWLARERQWLQPRYDRTKQVRARFRHLDAVWSADPHQTGAIPPSYTAAVFDAMGRATGIAIDISYDSQPRGTSA